MGCEEMTQATKLADWVGSGRTSSRAGCLTVLGELAAAAGAGAGEGTASDAGAVARL